MSPRHAARTNAMTSATQVSRIPRCAHTLLTKPECHCQACLSEQIAQHGRRATLAPANQR